VELQASSGRWSIAECAEHIGVTETLVLNLITEKALKVQPSRRSAHSCRGKILADDCGGGPSTKFKAPEAIQPTRRWATSGEITKNVLENRARTVEFSVRTQENLRDHFHGSTQCSRRSILTSGYC